MEIIYKDIDELIPYENNPRKNEYAVKPVQKSIERFKFRNPIQIDKDGVIIAGHTRLLAAKKLGIRQVPCIVVDDLTPAEIKAYRIAENKTSEFAEFDDDKLKIEFEELSTTDFDWQDAICFSDIEIMMITDEVIEEKFVDTKPPVKMDKEQYKEYEQKANEVNLEAYNVIIACFGEGEMEELKQLIGETGRLKRFYRFYEIRGLLSE